MRKRVDATQGPLVKLIFSFSIPLILTTIMQHLFEIADKAVLGQMADATAVASVGVTGVILTLVINGFVGLSTGTGIILARFVGQKNGKNIKETVETALISSVAFGVLVAVVGIVFAPQFLSLVNCPAECYDGALIYFRIRIAASPFALLYNYGAVIVRTFGDTQRPLYYIIISGIVNVVLNVILCFALSQKVIAVAVATFASKLVSAILVTRRIFKFDDVVKLSFKDFRFRFNAFKSILRFGIPVAVSNLLLPIANLQITPAINSYGAMATAGNTAGADLMNITTAITGGFSAATATFMGQNIGAKKDDRVRKSFWYTLIFATVFSGLMGVFLYLTGEFWVGLIIGTGSREAIDYALTRVLYTVLPIALQGYGVALGSAEQAYGYPFVVTLKTIICILGFRVFWMNVIYPLAPSFDMVIACFTVSWVFIAIFNTVAVLIITHRYRKGIYKKI